jgi:hypothetical protein
VPRATVQRPRGRHGRKDFHARAPYRRGADPTPQLGGGHMSDAPKLLENASATPWRESKVIGLGAPISVRIHFRSDEVPIARVQLLVLIAEIDQACEHGGPEQRETVERQALAAMLEELDANPDGFGGASVLWPTSLAQPVTRATLERALTALSHPEIAPSSLPALAQALSTAQACLQTWIDLTESVKPGETLRGRI